MTVLLRLQKGAGVSFSNALIIKNPDSVLSPSKICAIINPFRRCDGMADVTDSKSVGGDTVWVQVPPPAPYYHLTLMQSQVVFFYPIEVKKLDMVGFRTSFHQMAFPEYSGSSNDSGKVEVLKISP